MIETPPFIKEVFESLGKGHSRFLSNNGSDKEQRLFEKTARYLDDYNDYLAGLGFEIIPGDGYFYMTNEGEASALISDKLSRIVKLISLYNLLTIILDGFEPGSEIVASQIEQSCMYDIDHKEALKGLSSAGVDASLSDHVDSNLGRLLAMGYIREESAHERRYKGLSSLNYIREWVAKIQIEEGE
tara:strand:- start:985 stop:1542 length:558 start_codon:yes stop_codon:yes gene_type:complete